MTQGKDRSRWVDTPEKGDTARRHILGLIRLYTYYSPIRKGKFRLIRYALRCFGRPSGEHVVARTVDGRDFLVDLNRSQGMYDSVYFLGEYERFITEIVSRIVLPGDVCLDVGANYGWYTMLMAGLCGPIGEVHAFEPVPRVYSVLRRNLELAGTPGHVHLRNVVVSDAGGEGEMHLFAGLPHGHSSLSSMGRTDTISVSCPMTTLDAYVEERRLPPVRFIKCDVEGAELKVLKGAQSIFSQEVPPIWIIEMARETSSGFGYLPNDLLVYMKGRADYEYFAVNDSGGSLRPIVGFAAEDIGANVLCVPAGHYRERLSRLAEFLR